MSDEQKPEIESLRERVRELETDDLEVESDIARGYDALRKYISDAFPQFARGAHSSQEIIDDAKKRIAALESLVLPDEIVRMLEIERPGIMELRVIGERLYYWWRQREERRRVMPDFICPCCGQNHDSTNCHAGKPMTVRENARARQALDGDAAWALEQIIQELESRIAALESLVPPDEIVRMLDAAATHEEVRRDLIIDWWRNRKEQKGG